MAFDWTIREWVLIKRDSNVRFGEIVFRAKGANGATLEADLRLNDVEFETTLEAARIAVGPATPRVTVRAALHRPREVLSRFNVLVELQADEVTQTANGEYRITPFNYDPATAPYEYVVAERPKRPKRRYRAGGISRSSDS